MVQPAVARGQADARHAPAAARQARPLRLRRQELRRRRGARDRRLRARLSGERAGARRRGCGSSSRAALAAARARLPADPLPAELELPLRCDALAAIHFPRDRGEAEAGAPPARARRAPRAAARRRALARRRARRDAARPPGELVERYRALLPFTLTEHQERAIAEIDLDLAHDRADAAAAAGRRRLGQDGRRALRAAAGGRVRAAGRADGADRDARRAAFPDASSRSAPRSACARVLLTGSVGSKKIREELANGAAQIAVGTHALIQRDVEFADLAVAVVDEQHRFGVEQRQALARAAPARAAHDRDADPAHARADVYGDLAVTRDRQAAGEPQADRHGVGRSGALERGVRAAARPSRRRPPGVRRVPADRGSPRRGSRARRRSRPSGCGARSSRATASACCTAG